MRLLLVLILCLTGCTTPTPLQKNVGTFSDNGNGQYQAQVTEACAWFAYDAVRANPSVNGDALFILCLDEQGARSI